MIQKPSKVEKEYTFTYTELQRLLWLFGTSCAVEGQRQGREEHPIRFHTDVWIGPKVSQQIEWIDGKQ